METQVIRFKTAAETAERSEEELKTERRKLQREVSLFYEIQETIFYANFFFRIVNPLAE